MEIKVIIKPIADSSTSYPRDIHMQAKGDSVMMTLDCGDRVLHFKRSELKQALRALSSVDENEQNT